MPKGEGPFHKLQRQTGAVPDKITTFAGLKKAVVEVDVAVVGLKKAIAGTTIAVTGRRIGATSAKQHVMTPAKDNLITRNHATNTPVARNDSTTSAFKHVPKKISRRIILSQQIPRRTLPSRSMTVPRQY